MSQLSNLSIRRAAERATVKTASSNQVAANQANALLSTGPQTPEGKAKSSVNAVKNGLTGRTVLLPRDSAAEYEEHILAYQEEFSPIGAREADLVQSISETAWRLTRIASLEAGIYAIGHIEFADSFQHHDPSLRTGLIQVETFLKYEKQLRNLHLQESRLARRREKELAELRQLQQTRHAKEIKALEELAKLYIAADSAQNLAELTRNGFEFSTEQVQERAAVIRAAAPARPPLDVATAA